MTRKEYVEDEIRKEAENTQNVVRLLFTILNYTITIIFFIYICISHSFGCNLKSKLRLKPRPKFWSLVMRHFCGFLLFTISFS